METQEQETEVKEEVQNMASRKETGKMSDESTVPHHTVTVHSNKVILNAESQVNDARKWRDFYIEDIARLKAEIEERRRMRKGIIRLTEELHGRESVLKQREEELERASQRLLYLQSLLYPTREEVPEMLLRGAQLVSDGFQMLASVYQYHPNIISGCLQIDLSNVVYHHYSPSKNSGQIADVDRIRNIRELSQKMSM